MKAAPRASKRKIRGSLDERTVSNPEANCLAYSISPCDAVNSLEKPCSAECQPAAFWREANYPYF